MTIQSIVCDRLSSRLRFAQFMRGIDRDITPEPCASLIDRHLPNTPKRPQVSIMLSHAPALAEQAKTWKFLELWVDPVLFPPKILMLVSDRNGTCRIFNPTSDYKLVVTHSNYQAAQEWLLEDEYERVKGQLLAEEVL
jgi:hypothetical protein